MYVAYRRGLYNILPLIVKSDKDFLYRKGSDI